MCGAYLRFAAVFGQGQAFRTVHALDGDVAFGSVDVRDAGRRLQEAPLRRTQYALSKPACATGKSHWYRLQYTCSSRAAGSPAVDTWAW